MALTTALLIGGAAAAIAGSTAGAIGSAVNNRKAQQERTRIYDKSRSFLDSQYYRDPLSTTGNRALLKSMDQRLRDQNEALENRAVAGGATMENQLAARKANNETMSNVYTNLLMGEDARRDAINQQKLQLDQQYSQGVQESYLQNAQNWQSWGTQMAQAGMNLASAGLLSGGSLPKVTGISTGSIPASVALRNNPLTAGNGLGQVIGPAAGGLVGRPW
ncbi:MAG: hypothetical protein IJU69_07255 [Bacteroidales bacterium]|nr:hypothetical protein [Bacteroidales bacterium]